MALTGCARLSDIGPALIFSHNQEESRLTPSSLANY